MSLPTAALSVPGGGAQPWRLLGAGLLLYLLSFGALSAVGVAPVFAWPFLVATLLMILPFAYGLARGLFLVGKLFDRRRWLVAPVGIALGVGLDACYRLANPALAIVSFFMLAILVVDCRQDRGALFRSLVAALGLLIVGFGTVNNLSYVAARITADHVHDPDLQALDLVIYRFFISPTVSYEGIFPLTESRLWFHLLENAYTMFVAEIFVVMCTLLVMRRSVLPFYRALFTCYLIGLITFTVYPAVAPDVYYPGSLGAAYQGTVTAGIARGLSAEYLALKNGLPLTGFGYFIALPSMHVTISVLSQVFLAASPIHFWTFLPINVLLVLSTVVLGHHYIVDVPAGLLLAAGVVALGTYGPRLRSLRKKIVF